MAWNVIASKPASFFKTRFEVPLSFVCFANSVVRNDGAIFINHSTFFVAPLRPFDNPFGYPSTRPTVCSGTAQGPRGTHSKYRLEESL